MKSDYRYSAGIVYNNFPWPQLPEADDPRRASKLRSAIEIAAEAVLATRAQFSDAPLAELYDPPSMPPALLKAHQRLDKAVDAAYGKTHFNSEPSVWLFSSISIWVAASTLRSQMVSRCAEPCRSEVSVWVS